MEQITLRILDGADRGRLIQEVDLPITIGREEGNTLQLNDERVSRFHLKIQRDHDKLVLTDLESTNGTKVNGEETQLRILKYGDTIALGRSVVLYGTREQIHGRLSKLSEKESSAAKGQATLSPEEEIERLKEDSDFQLKLLEIDPPQLPTRMSPGQAAQMSEVLEFMHLHLRRLLGSGRPDPQSHTVELKAEQWQSLIELQSKLAEYLREVANPND